MVTFPLPANYLQFSPKSYNVQFGFITKTRSLHIIMVKFTISFQGKWDFVQYISMSNVITG